MQIVQCCLRQRQQNATSGCAGKGFYHRLSTDGSRIRKSLRDFGGKVVQARAGDHSILWGYLKIIPQRQFKLDRQLKLIGYRLSFLRSRHPDWVLLQHLPCYP